MPAPAIMLLGRCSCDFVLRYISEAQDARLDLVERHLAALGDSLAYPAYIVNRVSSVFHKV